MSMPCKIVFPSPPPDNDGEGVCSSRSVFDAALETVGGDSFLKMRTSFSASAIGLTSVEISLDCGSVDDAGDACHPEISGQTLHLYLSFSSKGPRGMLIPGKRWPRPSHRFYVTVLRISCEVPIPTPSNKIVLCAASFIALAFSIPTRRQAGPLGS